MTLSRRTFLGGAAAGALVASLPGSAASASADAPPELEDRMASPGAWRDFLGRQDMVWTRLPAAFGEAPFLGNGGLGASLYKHPTRPRVQLTLGDSRVHDHQDVAGPSPTWARPLS
jgi:alpha-L-fucosidase 2